MPHPAKCWGCKGRSPLHEITLVSPFPAGEERSASAGRGDILPLRGRGAESKTKGRAGRRPKRQAAMRTPQRQCQPATPGASPRWVPASQVQPVPQTVKCRGAGGGSPRQNNFRVSPFPAGEGGGGIGATKKANGRGGRRPKRQAAHANTTAAGQANTAKNKRQYRKQHAIHC